MSVSVVSDQKTRELCVVYICMCIFALVTAPQHTCYARPHDTDITCARPGGESITILNLQMGIIFNVPKLLLN